MPFFDCPSCRLTVRLSNTDAAAGRRCRRCGEQLEGHPRSLLAADLPPRLRPRTEKPGSRGPQPGTPR